MITSLLREITEGERKRYVGAVLATCVSTAFLFAVPQVVRDVIDLLEAGSAPGPSRFAGAAALVVLFTAGSGAFLYLRGRLAAQASEGIARRLRSRIYGHLSHLPCGYHDDADTGDLVQRCTSDVETVRVFLSSQLVEIGRTILLLLIVIPVLLWMHVPMALLSLLLAPLIVTFAVLFFRRVQALFLEADEAEAEMTAVLQENLTGIRVVRAFARQEFECAKFAQHNGRHRDLNNKLISMLARYWSLSDVLCFIQFGVVLIGGAAWALRGDLSLGTWAAFNIYVAEVIWPVRMLGRTLTDAGKAVVALGRVREMLHETPEDVGDAQPEKLEGGIEIEGLGFGYQSSGGALALQDLNLAIRPGETVALLGAPGSGKSTLVHLLLRLYEYETGSIRLDGRELRSVARESVRSQIGVVLQEPFLYSKTVGENVRVGQSSASARQVQDAARAACIHAAIEEFEHGYETMVGERGVTLSGGQRQRVALARALLKRPPILILDDSLSAVDTRTEARILAELERRHGRHTTILIAHRLSSTRLADRVFVLEAGHVVQQGRHDELIGVEGPYRRLWQIQGELEQEIAAEGGGGKR